MTGKMSRPPLKLLFIQRHAPYGSGLPRESLDGLLTASAYGLELALLFIDDGVYQLLDGQNTDALGLKNLAKALAALSLYDIESIYVDQNSLTARALRMSDLIALPGLQTLTPEASQQLIQTFDKHLVF